MIAVALPQNGAKQVVRLSAIPLGSFAFGDVSRELLESLREGHSCQEQLSRELRLWHGVLFFFDKTVSKVVPELLAPFEISFRCDLSDLHEVLFVAMFLNPGANELIRSVSHHLKYGG